jgi:hypothetical protein
LSKNSYLCTSSWINDKQTTKIWDGQKDSIRLENLDYVFQSSRNGIKHILLNLNILEKPSVFDPEGKSTLTLVKLFYFDPSKVLTGGVIFILPCLLLGLHLSDAFAEEFDAV